MRRIRREIEDAGRSENEVRDRILDVAIELMSTHGVAGTTIKDITEASGHNIASVNYYFGSKDALAREVVLAIFTPVHLANEAALAAAVAAAAPGPVSLESLLVAMVEPLIAAKRSADGGRLIIRLMQHLRASPLDPLATFVSKHFDNGAQHFVTEFRKTLPKLRRKEVIWRYEMVRGLAIHILANCDPRSTRFAILTGDAETVTQHRDASVLRDIVQFARAGFMGQSRVAKSGQGPRGGS